MWHTHKKHTIVVYKLEIRNVDREVVRRNLDGGPGSAWFLFAHADGLDVRGGARAARGREGWSAASAHQRHSASTACSTAGAATTTSATAAATSAASGHC